MADIKDTVYVQVEYYDGLAEGDEGQPYYVAFSDDLRFTTQGDTFEELMANIRECIELSLHDSPDSAGEYGVAADAKVRLIMELPEHA